MNRHNYCIIMAGGVGARFWPMSRTTFPKQFLDILGNGKTLIRQAFDRFLPNCPAGNIYVVTNEIYKDLVLQQLPEISESQVLCEPTRRNTAPCIAYATYKICQDDPEANFVVAPSDHIILNEDLFRDFITSALGAAQENDWLITLGITPTRPDTGYGYIQFNTSLDVHPDKRIRKVKTFTEKPKLEMAKSFLASGDFLWNSGIFIWSGQSIMKAFEKLLPEVGYIFKDGVGKYNTAEEEEFIRDAYGVCKSISIDYGVMEKAGNVQVMVSDFGWSDLGTWGSLYDNLGKSNDGNAIIGKNVMTYNTTNCIVNVPKDKLVVLQGLDDYIVVESDGILLVCKKQDEQHIRQFVNDVHIDKGEKYV
ncbi:MAG: mannose-1-phosphate guanylyltransferase [Bacteroidetes bacterium]|nr:mannose-1-phosphate guanylyltransferase [Bacteroidota bacterium]MBU1720422.1 mannose-1-phosphate guanylyltransferase [Bacteroidota bacterium]